MQNKHAKQLQSMSRDSNSEVTLQRQQQHIVRLGQEVRAMQASQNSLPRYSSHTCPDLCPLPLFFPTAPCASSFPPLPSPPPTLTPAVLMRLCAYSTRIMFCELVPTVLCSLASEPQWVLHIMAMEPTQPIIVHSVQGNLQGNAEVHFAHAFT